MSKEELLLATKNRAITRCWLSHTSYGQIAAATAGLLWPVGIVVAGIWGIAAMGGFAGVILIGSVMAASKEADAIDLEVSEGNFTKMGEYLTQDDLLDLKRKAIAMGVTSPEKKMSPNTGQNPTSGNGTTAPNSGDSATLPRATAQLDDAAPHLFMVGRTREGKSETLKHLIGAEQRVWYVTSKATDKVPQHWQGYRVGGPQLGEQMTWLLDQWEASLLNHLEGADTDREWFVIDEAVGILQSLKTKGHKQTAERLRGFIVEMLTAGAAVNGFIGILSQTGNAGPLGIDEDLLKNFSIVGCGKRKKAQMVKAFCKLTDLRLTAQQEAEILSLDGYWQLWENNGPTLSQVPLSELPLKDVVRCPVADDGQGDSPPAQPTKSVEQMVLELLRKRGNAIAAWEIRNNIAALKKGSTDAAKLTLDRMVSEGLLQIESDGVSRKYRPTGTA